MWLLRVPISYTSSLVLSLYALCPSINHAQTRCCLACCFFCVLLRCQLPVYVDSKIFWVLLPVNRRACLLLLFLVKLLFFVLISIVVALGFSALILFFRLLIHFSIFLISLPLQVFHRLVRFCGWATYFWLIVCVNICPYVSRNIYYITGIDIEYCRW